MNHFTQDGLRKIISYTYLPPTDSEDWTLAILKAQQDSLLDTLEHNNLLDTTNTVVEKGNQSLIQGWMKYFKGEENQLHLCRCRT